MKMVGHDDPSQCFCQSAILCPAKLMNHQSAQSEVGKNRLAIQSVGGQQIDSIGFGIATRAQAM
jgi:hypothetical protein